MLSQLIRAIQPFNRPREQASLSADPVWASARAKWAKSPARRVRSDPNWRAMNTRVHELLRGRG